MAGALRAPRGAAAGIVVVPEEEFATTAATLLARRLSEAGAARPEAPVTVALSGGSTPGPVYERLAAAEPAGGVPWRRLHVFFADERRVPPDHPESNYRLVRERLLARAPEPPAAVHRMRGELEDGAAAAAEYEVLLPDRLDLVVLGIGEDGHTASLFPDDAALEPGERRVLAVRGPSPPRERLTLTPVPLRAARRRVVLARGSGKAEAVRRALREPGPESELPARLAREGEWVLDRAAASRLTADRRSS